MNKRAKLPAHKATPKPPKRTPLESLLLERLFLSASDVLAAVGTLDRLAKLRGDSVPTVELRAILDVLGDVGMKGMSTCTLAKA